MSEIERQLREIENKLAQIGNIRRGLTSYWVLKFGYPEMSEELIVYMHTIQGVN